MLTGTISPPGYKLFAAHSHPAFLGAQWYSYSLSSRAIAPIAENDIIPIACGRPVGDFGELTCNLPQHQFIHLHGRVVDRAVLLGVYFGGAKVPVSLLAPVQELRAQL